MTQDIVIRFAHTSFPARLRDSRLAREIAAALPLEATAHRWGREIYAEIPVHSPIDTPVREVAAGDLAYWPDGACFCIFFGPTPISSGGRIIPAGPVEIVGRLLEERYDDLEVVRDGATFSILPGNQT